MFLGGMLQGSLVALKAKGATIKSQFAAASLALQVFKAQSDLQKLEQLEQRQQQLQVAAAEQEAGGGGAAASAAEAPGAAAANGGVPTFASSGFASSGLGKQQQQRPAAAAVDPAALAAERVRLEEQALPLMLEAMWAANLVRVEALGGGRP